MKLDNFFDRVISKVFPNIYRKQIDRFFNNDTSFYSKINSKISILYLKCKKAGVKFIKHEKGKLYFQYKDKLTLVTDYSVGNLLEIFANEEYKQSRDLLTDDKYIVFDIGANKGFSSLYFALSPNVEKVIGFEIDPRLQEFINENKTLNSDIGSKLEINSFGLSDKDGEIDLYVLEQDDGVTTTDKQFYDSYWSEERKSKAKLVKAKIRKATDVIREYLNKFPDNKYMMTIDVEGAEYSIFKDLYESGVLKEFSIINGEYHNGIEGLTEYFGESTVVFQSPKKIVGETNIGTFILKGTN